MSTRTFVLDTSVLLADPKAIERFGAAEVVIPVVVLSELESKRNHPELGWAARQSLRQLEALRLEAGSLTDPVPLANSGGSLRVEVNHSSVANLPDVLRGGSNDDRVLIVAHNMQREARSPADVVVVSKDLPLRLKASLAGLEAHDYTMTRRSDDDWTGFSEMPVDAELIEEFYENSSVSTSALPSEVSVNSGLCLTDGSRSAIARAHRDGRVRPLRCDGFGAVRPKDSRQKLAVDLLRDNDLSIVSLGGPAGTGKSLLTLAAGLEAVQAGQVRRIIVFRPLFAVGGQDLGYLPGTEDEKMAPWAAAVADALGVLVDARTARKYMADGTIEVLPLTHIRGRTLTDTWVVLDEAQNLERTTLLTAITRVGEGSRVVLTHDISQRDNLRVGRHDGVTSVVSDLRGSELFGHVSFVRSHRSRAAAAAAALLKEH